MATFIEDEFESAIEYLGHGFIIMDTHMWMKLHHLAMRHCENMIEKIDTPSTRGNYEEVKDLYLYIFDQIDTEERKKNG